jgi:two-component system sensor histidine kinase BaeS
MNRPMRGLAARLLAAQLLVVAAASLTLAMVTITLAPALLARHAAMAPGTMPAETARHVNEGLNQALLLSLSLATVVGLAAAGGASWLVARRIVDPIRSLTDAATAITRTGPTARVPRPDTGDELATLATAFNTMADALEDSERQRRRLLTDLAHELRTPLATIEGYAEALTDGVIPAEEISQVLRTQVARLARLIDDLGVVSRAEGHQLDLHPVDCQPDQLVQAALAAAAPTYAAKGVTLASHLEPRLPAVHADPDRIGEVLANLLNNALRHTPAGGRVELTARHRSRHLVLTVTDTGEGIPAEQLERIFERFYRTDHSRAHRDTGGSGIGLTIARALVQGHNGHIYAHSDGPGHGTRFTITLPTNVRSHTNGN